MTPFWIFMLIFDLIIPFTMLGFGKMFIKKAPDNINHVFGYRTSMSMKNKDTWNFAHEYCGKLWYKAGLISLPVSVIILLFALGKDKDTIGTFGAAICYIQMVPLILSIVLTEKALKKTFDKFGKRKL